MSESPYNPIAAALANAVADATGLRFTVLPLKADRLFPALHEKFGAALGTRRCRTTRPHPPFRRPPFRRQPRPSRRTARRSATK